MNLRKGRCAMVLLCSLLLMAAALAGCAAPKAATDVDLPAPAIDPTVDMSRLSKELNVYNWTEYLPDEVLTLFTDLYGVKVNYDTYSSNEELHAKLRAGGAGYDVIFPSDYMIRVLAREGLLQQLDLQNIANIRNIDGRFRGLPFDPANAYSVPYMWGTTGIIINTGKVKTAVTGWADLWKPEFRNRLVMPDDAREVIGLALRTSGQSVNTTDAAALEAAKNKLKDLKPNIKSFNSDSPKDLLLGGDVVGGVVWSGEAAMAIEEDSKFTYILPAEGSTIWMDNMAIPRGARNKYTAEVFINFLLDPAVSARLSVAYMYGNPNKEALKLLPAFFNENPAVNPSAEALKNAEWLEDLGDEGSQLFDRIWTEVKG